MWIWKERTLTYREQEKLLTRLGQLLSLGYSFLEAVDVLFHASHGKERDVLKRLEYLLSTGASVKEAFHLTSFSPDVVLMVAQAETHGQLADALKKASEWKRRQNRFRAELRKALIYPVLLLAIIGLIFHLLFHLVIPQLATMLTMYDLELPLVTQLTLTFSHMVRQQSPFFGLVLFSVLIFFLASWRQTKVQLFMVKLLLKCPVVNQWVRILYTVTFCGQLGYLLYANVPLFPALQKMLQTSRSSLFKQTIKRIEVQLLQGFILSQAVEKEHIFVPELGRAVYHAEKSGQLANHLVAYGQHLEQEWLDRWLERLKWVEPVLLVLIGCVTAYLFLALFNPIFQLLERL